MQKFHRTISLIRVLFAALAFTLSSAATAQNVNFQVIHEFNPAAGDGGYLYSGVTFDSAGNMYGASAGGGMYARGTVYEISPNRRGGSWNETVLYSFLPPKSGDGAGPYGPITIGADGVLYGTTTEAGQYGYGVAFSLTPNADGWTEAVIHSFQPTMGAGPASNLVQDSSGNLFGEGGFIELSPSGDGWTFSLVCNFQPVCASGPATGTAIAPNGKLYVAGGGGKYKVGSVYVISKTKSGWLATDLFDFGSFPDDGQIPTSASPLVADSSGNIYGTTGQGGANRCGETGCGTIYKLTRGAGGAWAETILYNFQGGSNGYSPTSGVVFDKYGSLYGSAGGGTYGCGVTYRLSPAKSGTWTYTVLHNFDCNDGVNPLGTLAFDSAGNLYGATFAGGTYNGGEIFEISRQ